MGLLNGLAKLAGERARMKRTQNQEYRLDAEDAQRLNNLKQNAQNGNAAAMFELGVCYYQGKYVGYDPEQACHWWTEAAERGNVNAQYNLGLLYHGDISEMYYDENLAGYWFYTAAQNGDAESENMLNQYYKYSSIRKRWTRR